MGSCVSEPWGTHLRLGGAPVQVWGGAEGGWVTLWPSP